VSAALATADAAPYPDPSHAYTDVLDTGADRWT
jgi:hypothetical protein